MRPCLPNPIRGLRILRLVLLPALLAAMLSVAAAKPPAKVAALGDDTYQIVRSSKFLYTPGTAKLAKKARAEAAEYCRELGRQMKEISLEEKRGDIVFGDFAKVTLTFRAVLANDPSLATPAAAAAVPAPATDLEKVEELHRAGVLPSTDYEAAKRRAAERSLDELHAKGILTDTEYAAAKKRLADGVR